MEIAKLIDIDLISSSVGESLHDEYDDTHTYVIDNKVCLTLEEIQTIEDCEDAWNEYVDGDVTSTLDISDFKKGSGSVKLAVADACGAEDILATEVISKDISQDSILRLWIKSTVTIDLGDLQILLDNTASCVSPIKTLNIPALVADTWTEIDIDLEDASELTAVISIGVKMIVDKGAFDLHLDDIRAFIAERTPHEIYKSLADANTDNYPPDNGAKWSSLGMINKWKMFDKYINTQTEDSDDIVVEIDASNSDCIGLFGLIGKEVIFTLMVDGDVQKTEVVDLDDSLIYDYYDYFFADFFYKADIFWRYPVYYSDAVLKIEIKTYQGEAKCGLAKPAKTIVLGETQYIPQISANDYSKEVTDSLGQTYLAPGNTAKKNEFDLWLQSSEVDVVRRILESVSGAPILINANEPSTNYESLIVYGFRKNFLITIPGPIVSKCSLEIKGLT